MSIDEGIYIGSHIHVDTEENINELMRVKLDNEDFFRNVRIQGVVGSFLIPNRRDCGPYGGLFLDESDTGVFNYPKEDFSHTDWVTLIHMLEAEKIQVVKKVGVLRWFY